jgi:glycosyltransferase involved in cell wall biosynthesis
MKVLHVSTFDRGGAAAAAVRLHLGMLKCGMQSKMLIRYPEKKIDHAYQFTPKETSLTKRIFFKLGWREYRVKDKSRLERERREQERMELRTNLPEGLQFFSFPFSDSDITQSRLYREADIINLHWVSDFVDYQSFFLKNKKKVIWTLHDMEPFQGGIHYEEKYFGVDENGQPVPYAIPEKYLSLIGDNLNVKREAISNATDLEIVAPSNWLLNKSKQSELLGRFAHYHIPYGLDTTKFTKRNKERARQKLQIPSNSICLLFVADHVNAFRKGFDFLQRALREIKGDNILLCAVGHGELQIAGIQIKMLGHVNDETMMSEIYSAADVFLVPSIEDNLPNTVLESLVCGTPVIGFPVGGIVDMVQDGVNGYLCSEISVPALVVQLKRFLFDAHRFDNMKIHENASAVYNDAVQSKSYHDLYTSVLHSDQKNGE